MPQCIASKRLVSLRCLLAPLQTPAAAQGQVFEELRSTVEEVLEGTNSTIITYGALLLQSKLCCNTFATASSAMSLISA